VKEPTLSTARLTLRPLREGDATDIYAYCQDPEVLQYTHAELPQNLADSEAFLASLLYAPANEYAWAICVNPGDRCDGMIEFDHDGAEGAIHYALAKDLWGKGFASEAVDAVVHWVRSLTPGLSALQTYVFVANGASRRVLEKNGFVCIGQKTTHKSGQPVEEHIMRLELKRQA
jgi:RimJ/RimL family protein N-acetyltransferase